MSFQLSDVVKELFIEVRKENETSRSLSDNLLSSLNCVFGQCLLYALDLVDKKAVTKYRCPSGRTTFKVTGSSGVNYLCLASSNYCTCPSYVYTGVALVGKLPSCCECLFVVLVKREALMCKHVLAMHLCCALDSSVVHEISDADMTALLSES
eukprot:m.62991 g.62991  ORF g.62991 m.62991 type:complete len:153 (+) comp35126_c0_seq6:75-533(+)